MNITEHQKSVQKGDHKKGNQQADFNPQTLGDRKCNPLMLGGTLYASVFEANDSHFMFSFYGALNFFEG